MVCPALSQSDLRVHFGAATAEELTELEVRWPNGERRRYAVGRVNRFITIDQRTGIRDDLGRGE